MPASPLTSTLASLLLSSAELTGGTLERVEEELRAWDPSLDWTSLRLAHEVRGAEASRAQMDAALDTLPELLTSKERRRALSSVRRVVGAGGPGVPGELIALAAARLDLDARAPSSNTRVLDVRTEIVAPAFQAREPTQLVAPAFVEPAAVEHTQLGPPAFAESTPPESSLLGEHFDSCLAAFTKLLARELPLGRPSAPLLASWTTALAVLRREARDTREAFLLTELDDAQASMAFAGTSSTTPSAATRC